jgi:O-antigen ligase
VARDQALADGRAFELAKTLLLFGLVALLVQTRIDVRALLWALLLCAALLASLGLFQVSMESYTHEFGGLARVKYAHIVGTTFEPRIAGPLGDPNFFAQMLILVVPFGITLALQERWLWARIAAAASTLVVIAGIVFTYSRGGAVALALTLALALLPVARVLRLRRTVGIVLLGILLIAVLVPRDFVRRLTTLEQFLPSDNVLRVDTSFEERRLLTTSAWLIFVDHPLIGVGAGNYTQYFDEYVGRLSSEVREYEVIDDVHYPHNLYLEIAAETGLAGLVSFGALIALAFATLYGSIRRSRAGGDPYATAVSHACSVALMGYLVSALFLHGHFQRSMWVVLALGVSLSMMTPRRAEP